MLANGKINNKEFRFSWLRLARTNRVGAKTFNDLINFFGDPQKALDMLPSMVKSAGSKSNIRIPTAKSVQTEISKTKNFGAKFILSCDREYPEILRQIPDAPPVLIAKGRVDLLNQKAIAIIGARNSSINGNRLANDFSRELSKHYRIISGMARGIDSYVHKAGLENGTIGVIAGGINSIYPKENNLLYKKLYEDGLIVTEQAIDSEIYAKNFPQRNRIIAGLSIGVLVIEASIKSGTLITCKYAIDYNREVLAIPGSPLDNNSQGTNKLIKEGATLVISPQDVLNSLSFVDHSQYSIKESKYKYTAATCKTLPSEDDLRLYRSKLLDAISYDAISLNDLTMQLNIPINVMNFLLLELELSGRIIRLSGNRVQYIK